MLFLHETAPGIFWLDHRLVPEVRGMLAAQSSRAPVGGVKARYAQVVDAVAESLLEHAGWPTLADCAADPTRAEGLAEFRDRAEERLCVYPLHPRVKVFFNDFVGKYGHSSILELVGGVPVFSEGISWHTAWLTFDSPLCAGQEFSTRAVQHRDWPMARECSIPGANGGWSPHPDLLALHNDWFEVFEAEVAWWKNHLASEENRRALGIGDKEPFRPALDRARWALPGTIATGCAHTSSLRERARVVRDGSLLAQASKAPAAEAVWKDIFQAYKEALPGLEGMGLREAHYDANTSQVPGHLSSMFMAEADGPNVDIQITRPNSWFWRVRAFTRPHEKAYLDPVVNTRHRVDVLFRCSLAVARDWHRHRTLYPMLLQVVRKPTTFVAAGQRDKTLEDIQIDPHYAPMSDTAKHKTPELLARSTRVFDAFMRGGNIAQAALALPFGTRVCLRGQGGLRDVVYLLELRKYAHGASFEYQDQATQALDQLRATGVLT